MQTPWWVPVLAFAGVVLAAAIGGVAGFFGHVLTQRRTDPSPNTDIIRQLQTG
jgi:hypothetical protein